MQGVTESIVCIINLPESHSVSRAGTGLIEQGVAEITETLFLIDCSRHTRREGEIE